MSVTMRGESDMAVCFLYLFSFVEGSFVMTSFETSDFLKNYMINHMSFYVIYR